MGKQPEIPVVQGEGDYDAARRYNQHSREHVEKLDPEELRPDPDAQSPEEGAAARQAAKSHSKAGNQDLRDAEVFRALEERSKKP